LRLHWSVGTSLRLWGGYALWKCEVDRVERYEQLFVVVDFLKGANDARFATHIPGEVFMRNGVLEAHALFGD
jgi:hypothetical protein